MVQISGEPPEKKSRRETDLKLCIKCQISNKKKLVLKPQDETYENFLKCINERALYGEQEYVLISDRLKSFTAHKLKENNASWHITCYSKAANRTHINRSKDRHENAVTLSNLSKLTKRKGRPSLTIPIPSNPKDNISVKSKITRSKIPKYLKERCFFCQQIKPIKLHKCMSSNRGQKIHKIVEESDNETWKVNYSEIISENDALSRDIMYHSSCLLAESQRRKPKTSQTSIKSDLESKKDLNIIAANIQFYSQLQEKIYSGEFIPINEAENDYQHIMKQYNLSYAMNRSTLKNKIQENICDVEFTRHINRSKPSLIHSSKARKFAVSEVAQQSGQEKVLSIFKCAKIVRKSIEQATPWKFTGSLKNQEDGIPNELLLLLKWIIQGDTAATTKSRNEEIQRTCTNISQMILQAFKSKRQISYTPKSTANDFRNKYETPLTLGVSLHCYHSTRSKNTLELISKAGTGVSYRHTLERVGQIARAVQNNIKENSGVYIPPGLVKGLTLRVAMDNIDAKVDTPDGKHSFHALAATAFQQAIQPGTTWEKASSPLQISSKVSSKLGDIPKTGVTLIQCHIKGNPKPVSSPHYPNFKPFKHSQKLNDSFENELVWLLARYANRKMSDVMVSNNETDISRQGENMVGSSSQLVPVWAAYNSLASFSGDEQLIDETHALPIINAPPQDWQTLVTSIMGIYHLNHQIVEDVTKQPPCVFLDMDLYKRIFKLPYLQPNIYKNKWIESPGQFHIVLCALRCLGKTIEGSGLDDCWVEAELYSDAVVNQIIDGRHYNRAIKCYQITLQVLYDLWWDKFFAEHPDVYENLKDSLQNLSNACKSQTEVNKSQEILRIKMIEVNLNNLILEFDKKYEQYPMYKWTRMCMRQITNLQLYLSSIRQRNWLVNLAALEELCIWIHAYNRLDYAMHLPEYIARMYELKHTHPKIWEDLENGGFTVKTSQIAFTAIGVDQAQEHVNKIHKGKGGVCGLTTNPEGLLRYCLSTPELSRLSAETEQMLGIKQSDRDLHHDLSSSKLEYQEQQIQRLKNVLSRVNLFPTASVSDGSETMLIHLTKKIIIPDVVKEDILKREQQGRRAYEDFVKNRICGEQNLWDKMTKLKVFGWNEIKKTVKTKMGADDVLLKESNSLMARLLVITRSSRDMDLKEIIGKYEFSPINKMIMSADGRLHPCSDKAQLIHILEALVETHEDIDASLETPIETNEDIEADQALVDTVIYSESALETHINTYEFSEAVLEEQIDTHVDSETTPANSIGNTTIFFDAMAVVHEMIVYKESIKTCNDMACYFAQAIDKKTKLYGNDAYVIFDNYSVKSVKEITRQRRTGGTSSHTPEYKIDNDTKVRDFKKILNSNKTKDLLTLYLAQQLIENCKCIVTTVTRLSVLTNHASQNVSHLHSKQVEADTMLIFYAAEVHKTGKSVCIYSPDTDVLVLAIASMPALGDDAGIIMGTRENRQPIKIHPIYHALGENKAQALVGFHALSGCDTTGRIHGKSKSSWWDAFKKSSDKVINALCELGISNEPSEETLSGCEELICNLLSPKNIPFEQAPTLRWHYFRGFNTQQCTDKLPPTRCTIHELVKRSHHTCNIWKQALIQNPKYLELTDLGWQVENNGEYMPILTKEPLAPDCVLELARCGCSKSQCSGRCSCKEKDLTCTELCKCDPDNCKNMMTNSIDSESDDDL